MKIVKRDGHIVDYDPEKIRVAIGKANNEVRWKEKISKEKRNTYPILVDSNDTILWIPNIKKSKYNVKKNEFYDIILTSHKEGEEINENEKKKQ